MIISPGRGYVFVHIPKTGGTALALALEDKAKKDDILIGDTPKAKRRRGRLKGVQTAGRVWKHSTLADIEGLVAREALAEMFVFTITRNPWDRIVSYYHWLRAQSFHHPAVRLAQENAFEDFVLHRETAQAFQGAPVALYTRDSAGMDQCDMVLRLERLDADAEALGRKLGMKLGPIAPANMSERARDWRPYYGDRAAARVAEICAEDIARFEYRFDDG